MAPLSLKIILDEGAVTRTLKFDTTTKVWDAHCIVKEKILTLDPDKEYGFFLTSADDDNSGVWLSNDKTLEYYMLRDGDSVQFLTKMRNIRLRMLDGSVKTLQVDESKIIEQLLVHICSRIGITNYEEYGLCREEDSQNVEETKSNTGTLTLKKKSKIKDKDVQLEQLSKKLKTDDNVEWLDQHKTLRECGVDTKETLLFKRRLFYSDRNIDSRDPVQLNLLYVQTRDAILNGKQVVTEDKAAEFAGIQCQIQYGDFQEEKHKPGFIENLKEFLPEQYASSWSVEKKIIKEHRKHNGLSQIEAKHLYTKTARELPTYGVTFFLVKEKQKGKKKLVPRLLGINSESILRLDEETKEILQVWLLTQVKSYRAGSESFTLNFGDYSEKEYAVKTNDAYRIRDILQGYIDIIRKRLAAPYNVSFTEGEAMLEDMVESSRGTITQTVVPRKVQEHSLVGPSQIISVDQSYQSQQGTRIVTVHEIITTTRTDKTQQAMHGEFGSSNSSQDFGKKLNRLNSEAVKAVVLLSDPTNENLQTVRKIVAGFEDDLPSIIKGANEAATALKEKESKKLLDDLDELCAFMNTLAATTKRSDLHDPDNLVTAQDAARKIAELSTQMCFSLDPKIKRCSKILSRSRKSFILDEKTEASLRRASFLNATDSACRAVEEAQNDLDEKYHGPRLTEDQIQDLERKTTARMGKLNAAIALLMNAHADPRNIDYEMAVNSMKTINEIMPGLIKDAKPLIANGDETTKRKLRDQIIQLLNGTRAICMLTGSDDISKMHDIGNDYAEVSKKLIFTFNRPSRASPEGIAMHNLENEIMQLAKDVGEKVSSLLTLTSEVANYDPDDPQAMDVCTASAKCADSTQGLLACTKLTAPLIQEPHCQSALTAAAENLSSSVQNLALVCKPLVEKPGRLGLAKSLADKSFDLAKALDKLKSSYAHLNTDMQTVEEDDSDMQEQKRLKFIISPKMAKDSLTDAHNQLQELINTSTIMAQDPINNKTSKNVDAQRLLSQKMAELNGAIASLLQSTTDPENPDTDTAIAAIEAITTLTPNIINDTKDLQGTVNENEWNNIMKYLKDILDITQDICAEAENGNIEGLNDAASKMGKSSGRLTFVFNPRSNSKKKDEILDLSKLAVKTASELQPKLENLAKCIDREDGHLLKSTGAKIVDAAEDLLKTAEVIAPSIEDSRCQAALLSAIGRLSERAQQLHNSLELSSQTSQHGQSGENIKHDLKHIQTTLDKLQQAVQDKSGNGNKEMDSHHDDKQRLHFIAALSRAKNAVIDAENELKQANNKPLDKSKQIDKLNVLEPRNLLSERLARLNGAIANLLQATSDERPNFEVAAAALNTISSVTPDIIKDANALQGSVDDKSWNEIMESLKSILDATKDMCSNDEDPQVTSEAAMKLANSVGRLTYVVNPRKNVDKENQILDLSKSAVEQTSAMLSNVYQLIEEVGGDDGEKLDNAGVNVVDTAQMLLKTAEITAPSMEDHLCQKALLSAIDRLSGQAKNLQSAWKPLAASQKYHQTGKDLDQKLKEVETTINKLREACKDVGGKESESQQRTQELEKQRLHFNATLSRTKDAVIDADKELKDLINKPFDKSKPLPKHDVPATRNLLSERLAKLNAAIANLLQATSDNERPDLEAAAAAINTISTITPDVIKDVKRLQGSVDDKSWAEIIENLKSILDATNDMCSNEEDPQATSEASLRLANSVGRLTYVVNPRKNANKENQILDLSKSAVEQTSAMLSNVYQLIEEVGGDDGEKLDKAGVKVVDTAQMLLKTAEITAPSMKDDLCQKALLSAIDRLSDRARNLQSAWKPLAASPKYHQTGEDLDQNLKQVESTLDKLRKACKDVGEKENESHQQTQEQEKERLHFNATLSRAKNTVTDADKELKELMNKPRNKTKQFEDHNVPSTRKLLSERLARLNATIANLLQATSDNERPNLEVVAAAVETISNVTPGVIDNVKTLQGSVDDKAWAEIMEGLKSILEATKDMCSSSEDPQAITDSSMNLAKSVGRLTYVINPRKNVEKENQILDLSKNAVEKTSGMLSNVYQMIEDVGGAEGNKLDEVGVKVVDSAQKLLKTAEITAPSMENSLCQETLLSAIDRLSDQARDLQSAWKPLAATPKYHQTGQHLDKDLREVQSTLDKLREACQAVDGSLKDDKTEKEIEEQKKQRLQFVSTLSKAKNAMIQADKELKDVAYTTPKVKSVDDKNNAPAIRNLLSQRLAELNAAIANLLQATSDRDKPDYENAAASINTISNLAPAIIKDAKGLQGSVDDKSWKVIMDNLKSLIDSTSDLCANSENPQELSDTATKFANSAGRLTYVLNPRKSTKKETQIINLAKSAVEDTSILLSDVYQLTESIGGKDGEKLDTAGVKVVDSAKILLKTAEVTASSVEEPRCQQALLRAIDHLSDRADDLQTTWDSLTESPQHRNARGQLSNKLKQVQTTLENLRQACQEKDLESDEQEKQQLELIATLSDAKKAVKDAQDDLKKVNNAPPSTTLDKSNVPAAKMLLSKKLAQLNAGIAELLQATSDTVKPDYKAAAKAINNISSLTPQIVKDTKNLHGAVEDKSWKTLIDNLKALLDSTNDVCNHVEDPQALKNSASKFANAAGRLTYVFNPHSNVKKENQIQDLSRCALEQTSLLLSNVYNLTEKVGGKDAESMDLAGVRVVDSAQTLLRTAEITSPSINNVHCQNALLASIDKLADDAQVLKNTWMPLVQAPQYHSAGDQLDQNVKIVHATLDKLRKACQNTDDSKDAKPDRLLKNISKAKQNIRAQEKLFSEDNMAQRAAEARSQGAGKDKPVMTRRIDLSQKLAKLNEAVARLLQAMLDRESPDYKSAEVTVDVISKLTPDILQETMALQSNLDDNSGRIIFEEAKNICDASQAICTSVENNSLEDLNKAAIKYAQSSGKLRYVVSPRSYPNKQKTILDVCRSVCERTSLMLSRVSRLAENVGGSEGENMGISGAKLGDAAHALFTNVQVLSSSIEDQNCQSALSSSADRLSKCAQDLESFWKPVIQHPQHRQIGEQLTRDSNLLNSELDKLKEICHDNSDINNQLDVAQQQQVSAKPQTKPKPPPRMEDLDNLLENIQKTVANDSKKNRVEERLLIEDTPLRQLASKIMESAKAKAESNSYSPKEREKYSRFANELAHAINRLDITNAKCRDTPFDAKDKNEKALHLENAILNLQVLCIQSRQEEGQQSKIVDLMEFVEDVTSAADALANTVKDVKHNEKAALMEIKNKCQKIQDAATKLTQPQDLGTDGNMFEDTLLIDKFNKNCDADIKEITAVINNIADASLKKSLLHKLQTLSDSCDLLSFATKSSISNTESTTLEESLQNLELVEQKLEDILKPVEGLQSVQDTADSVHAVQAVQAALAAAAARGAGGLPHALTCYAVQMRGVTSHKDGNYKLKEHLKKLTDILKMQIAAKNRRVVTWQEDKDGELSTITENILEELQRFVHDIEAPEKGGVKSSDPLKTTQLIKNSDIKRLLSPNKSPELGDEKHLKEKFNQQIQKLNSTTGTIALSVHKPDSLTRSLHTASEAAIQLASIAHGLKNQDPVQSNRIETAAQEMSVATYNLLKTAESVCHSSHLPESRRRLLDACRLLNDSLNNLARATTPANMQRDCNEMSRNLQLQQSFLTSEHPSCSLNYAQCLDALQSQQEVLEKLRSEKTMSRTECSSELRFVTSAICNSTESAAQSAYLLTLSNKDKDNVSKQGMVDVSRIKDLADSVNKTCLQIICNDGEKEISDQQSTLAKQVDQLQEAVDDACTKIKDEQKDELSANAHQVKAALKELNKEIKTHTFEHEENRILPRTIKLMDAINKLNYTLGRIPQPNVDKDPKKAAMAKEVIDNNRNLLSNTLMMLKKASLSQEDMITWTKIGSIDVIKAFEALLTCIREKGAEAGYIEAILDSEVPTKSYIQTQVDLACQWLRKPVAKESDKKAGVEAAENVVRMAEQMYEDLKGSEKEEMKHVIVETKQLLNDCTVKYHSEKASLLRERLKELLKMLERGVVTRVIEDFLEEDPLPNLEALHKENDEKKRKFLLEKKIAELLAQLGRVTKTARFVADTGVAPRQELLKTSDQVELLAPVLVKAAEQRIHRPDDQAAIEHYQRLLAQYAESLSRVRELCDRAVDPIDFSQAAGETMHRIKEETMNEPHKSVHTSKIIMTLCNRVIDVGMNSQNVKKDPELKKTLIDIKRAVDAKCEVKKADWRDVTAEFMRRTGEVESVLGGENIFLKQPEPDQPIYAAALDLHAAVREWSARDNDMVAVAKRMAVLMAKLSDHMNTGRKQELIYTSNSIVNESKEVAALAKKMALECSDIRIRNNLLQVCDQIPTISGQLKMLTTVKSSSLGHQDSTEDKEAMNMLVGNAQNLMTSVQEVVKAAASASVKIMSQRGYRMKWRRRNYY